MPRRIVIVPLTPPRWVPPGLDPARWRRALADDMIDILATLAEVEPALAVAAPDRAFADGVAWPGMPVYAPAVPTAGAMFEAAVSDGYEQAVLIAPDVPDLPGMLIAKLLRPLTTKSAAVAPDAAAPHGLLGLATRLPAAGWLHGVDLDTDTVASVRARAPSAVEVIGTPGWHRLRDPEALRRLDPDLDGWDQTRALLSGSTRR